MIYARSNWAERECCLTSFDLQLIAFGPVLLPRLKRGLSPNPATCFPMTSNAVWKHIATGAAGTRQIARADPTTQRLGTSFPLAEILGALLAPTQMTERNH